jgi:hypothetical protein
MLSSRTTNLAHPIEVVDPSRLTAAIEHVVQRRGTPPRPVKRMA